MEAQNQLFCSYARSGQIEDLKRAIVSGNVDINYQDPTNDENSALHQAVQNNHIDIVRMLLQNEAEILIYNREQQSPLHLACEKCNKEMVFLLVINGADVSQKNNSGQKPGDGNTEIKTFINNIFAENRAFLQLKPQQKAKLTAIFEDIDIDGSKSINHEKAVRFNKYIEESINDQQADKDAKDFIKCTALCNQTKVNIDEWLFSFSKLLVVDQQAFDKFIEDYDKMVEKKQKLRLQPQD